MDNESSRDQSESEKKGVLVSYFDCSVENFCASMDLIKDLCGLPSDESIDAGEMERLSSMITFLKEWKYFVYEPKTVNFACEIGDGRVKDDFDVISLPQFSSAAVPKMENLPDEARCLESDFVLHAGSLVWAMDWCPNNLEKPDNNLRCEYLAVAAHPPGSTYHKIGSPLIGRGIIQIWCLLCLEENMEIPPEKQRKHRWSYKNRDTDIMKGNEELTVQRHRGRPKGSFKKKQVNILKETEELMVRRPRGRPKGSSKKGQQKAIAVAPTNEEYYQSEMVHSKDMAEKQCGIPNEAGLPKVVLCLAHMGKVAWDVKWRPANVKDSEDIQHLGYLAVLLGNGSLEVWEVPLPRMVKILHASCRSDGTDPRFLKLKPMFRCSKVQCGDRQSIPLTLEWSPFAPHDLILAGCHDGTVALWKFTKQQSSQDIKPLLCFSADSVPIRSLAWAPDQSNAESANLIVTAGHEGLKFWDLRDPYRPLWEHCPLQRIILCLEWLKDPRCLIMSYDNGELRMLSLWNVANDVLVTGEPAVTTKQPGLHSYSCSDFAIWGVHVSQATGLAAYCTADGSVCYFQLTANAVEKDSGRYREPHFLCGSLTADGRVFKIKTPQPNVTLPNIPKKKVPSEMGDAPLFSYLTDVNQARGNALVGGDNQTLPVMKFKSNPRCSNKKSSNKQPDPGKSPNQPFVKETDEEPEKATETSGGGPGKRFGEFPPKEVAMHRVRWNMNKGSERWLCYGGTAGLIRCQKISRIHGMAFGGAKATPPVCSQIQPYECKKQ